MNRLERYALREVLAPTGVAFAVYTGFMLVRGLILFSDLILQSGNPLRDAALVAAFSLPHIVVLTLPIAFLLGILIGVGRLSADSELVAIRAAGIDLTRLYRPIGALGAALWVLTAGVMIEIVPRTNRILYSMRLQLSTFAIAQRIQPGVFTPELAGRRIYVERASADRRTLEGIVVSDRSDPSEGERLTLARRGTLEMEEAEGRLWLRLEDAVTHHTHRDPSGYDRTSYQTQRILLDDSNPRERFAQLAYDKQLREQTVPELLSRVRNARQPTERRQAGVELHKKFALPTACLVFAFIGLPLGVVNRRGGRAAGFAVSAAIVLGYYMLLATGEANAIEGAMSPWLAMWLPNLLLTALGLFALARVRRDQTLFEGWRVAALLSFHARPKGSPVRGESPPAGTFPADAASVRAGSARSAASWIVDRYVSGRFLRLFALVLTSILILYVLVDYMEISDDIARTHPPLSTILAYIEAKLAPILVDVVPFAFLAAALVAVAGLVRTSETTALLAHGISLLRSVASVVLLSLLTGVLLYGFSERIVPRASTEAERLRNVLLGRPTPIHDGWQTWFRGDGGRFLSADAYDPGTGIATNVTVLETDPVRFRLTRYSQAPEAVVAPGKGVLLRDGWTRTFGPDGATLFLKRAGTTLVAAPEASRVFLAGRADPRQMTTFQLARFIRVRQRAGADVARLSTGLHQKLALTIAPLLMTLVGLPFAFQYGRRGAVAGVGIALFLGLLYLVLSSILGKAGETGALPPALAAWGTNGFFFLGAAYGLLGVRT